MQAFSYLQRKINDQDYLTLGLIWLVFFVWESLSNLYPYMPPMFGLLITAAVVVQGRQFTIGLFAFLLFFEADHSYFLFSTWLYYYFHVNFLVPLISAFVDCKKCLLVLSVVTAYLLYYTMLFLLGAVFLEHARFYYFYPVLVYMLVESVLILVVGHVER